MKRKSSSDRVEFLSSLIKEFYTTKSLSAKKEVLANLANFAYNPINYAFLRTLRVIDVFLDCLTESDVDLLSFAISGLCNLSADPENKTIIIGKGGVEKISPFLDHLELAIILPALTSLIYLVGPSSVASITSPKNIETVVKHQKSSDKRLKNLATIFLEDLCSKEQIASSVSSQNAPNT